MASSSARKARSGQKHWGDYNLAVGYQRRKKDSAWIPAWGAPPARREELLSAGDRGIWTNLEDLLRRDVAVRERKLLKPATREQALAATKTRDGVANHNGFGWLLRYVGPKKSTVGERTANGAAFKQVITTIKRRPAARP